VDRRVQIVITLMENHLHRDLSLEEMAQSVNLSASRFRHLFKAEVGVSPVRHLRLLRMQRAREMVETTFLSMKEIMSMVGVSDKRHFAEDFKRAYGLTPAKYRIKCHDPHIPTKNTRRRRVAVSATK
jgi:transcriptional regulator GlxA family with amidase domain